MVALQLLETRDESEQRCFRSTSKKERSSESVLSGREGMGMAASKSDIESESFRWMVRCRGCSVFNTCGAPLPSTVGLCRGPTAPLSHTSVPLSHPTSLATA
jgi:hypothetical protein